jgi:uncharacterized Tic20 family protein
MIEALNNLIMAVYIFVPIYVSLLGGVVVWQHMKWKFENPDKQHPESVAMLFICLGAMVFWLTQVVKL